MTADHHNLEMVRLKRAWPKACVHAVWLESTCLLYDGGALNRMQIR